VDAGESESRRDILFASKHVREAEIATRLHASLSLSLSLSLMPESSEAADGAAPAPGRGPSSVKALGRYDMLLSCPCCFGLPSV